MLTSKLSQNDLGQSTDYSSLLANTGMNKLKSQVLFSPGEDISTIDRIIVLRTVDQPDRNPQGLLNNDKKLTRGRLVRIVSHNYRERRMDAATRNGDEDSFRRIQVKNPATGQMVTEPVLPEVLKPAQDSASELYDAYSIRGVMWFEELAGIGDDGIDAIEKILLPVNDGVVDTPETLVDLNDHLMQLRFKGFKEYEPDVRKLLSSVLDKMIKATAQAIAYQNLVVEKIQTELFNRRHNANAQGIMALDDVHIHYFAMLKRVPQDKQIADLAERTQANIYNAVAMGAANAPVVTPTGAKCPYCAVSVDSEAVVCPNCKNWIDEEAEIAYNARSQKRKLAGRPKTKTK